MNKKKYWLRGGLWGIGLLVFSYVALASPDSAILVSPLMTIYLVIFLVVNGSLLGLFGYHDCGMSFNCVSNVPPWFMWFEGAVFLFLFFLIGAFIGFMYGEFKQGRVK